MGPVLNGLIKLQSVENQLRAAKAKLVRPKALSSAATDAGFAMKHNSKARKERTA